MDTPFEKLDREIKKEWLGHPATEAFFSSLGEEMGRIRKDILAIAAGACGPVDLQSTGARLRALEWTLDLATGRL